MKTNTQQIKSLSESYLMDIARERVQKFNEKIAKYESSAAFVAKRAGEIYNRMDEEIQQSGTYPDLSRSIENNIFYTPKTLPCITAFWGSDKISEKKNQELRALFRLDADLETAKFLTAESMAAHIITLSGIGKYFTENPSARARCFDLPPASVFDLRDGEPVTIYTRTPGQGNLPKITQPYKDDVIDGFIITATAPIVDNKGILRGIAGIDVPLADISRSLKTDSNKKRFFFFIGTDGELMGFPQKCMDFFGLNIDQKAFKHSKDTLSLKLTDSSIPEVKKIDQWIREDKKPFFRLTVDGEPLLLAVARFSQAKHRLVEVMSEREMVASIRRTGEALERSDSKIKYHFLMYALAFFIFSIVCISEAVRSVVRPIQHLTAFTRRIANKEYHLRSKLYRNDEIGDLSIALDIMAKRLGQYKTQEKNLVEDLSRQGRQLKQLNEYLVYFEESERKAIASELHSTIAQSLGIGVSKIRSLINREDPPQPSDLEELQAFLEYAVKDIRKIMYELAPPILNDFDIDVAIEFLIEEINEKKGTDFVFHNAVGGAVGLNKALKLTFYRAVKTLLFSILEQSDAPQAGVEISAEKTQLLIRMHACGAGIDTEKLMCLPVGSSGSHLLSERMRRLGGSMSTRETEKDCVLIDLAAPVLTDHPQE
ncbi:MAG: HAMP domain-containing protein [Desulfobacterales bacterium]|nr:HAMP domain-containing protein [Desulfobacterales bacterium]